MKNHSVISSISLTLFVLVFSLEVQAGVYFPVEDDEGKYPCFEKGRDLYDQKKYDKSITQLSTCLKLSYINMSDGDIYMYRGLSFKALSKFENAISDLTKSISIGNHDFDKAYVGRGLSYILVNKPDKALQDFKEAQWINKSLFDDPNFQKIIAETKSSIKTGISVTLPTQIPPAIIAIRSPLSGSNFSGDSVYIEYEVRSPFEASIDGVTVRVDGKVIQNQNFAAIKDKAQRQINIPLPHKNTVVTLTGRSGSVSSEPAKLDLIYKGSSPVAEQRKNDDAPPVVERRKNDGASPVAERRKPNLYALVVGVSDYVDPRLHLPLAAKDASDFASGLKTLEGGLYNAVKVRPLIDRAVTRDSIVEGLRWLEQEITERDIAIVFVSGHGQTDSQDRFWFLPSDVSPEQVRSRAVPYDDFNRSLSALSGKTLLFLDACHAGRAGVQVATRGNTDMNKVIDDFAAAGGQALTIFASSQGRELSQESSVWGNGAFTKAVLEGLFQGRAGRDRNGAITPLKLQDYIIDRVKELTGGTQHPTWRPAPDVPDFPIATVR